MDKDHRFAPVELIEHRLEYRIPQPVMRLIARKYTHTVGMERVECVLDLVETGINNRKRQQGEQSEAALIVRHHLRGVLVHVVTQKARFFRISEPCAGRSDRENSSSCVVLVHVLNNFGRRIALPMIQVRNTRNAETGKPVIYFGLYRLGVGRRSEVMMVVDDAPLAGRNLPRQLAAWKKCAPPKSRSSLQKVPPRQVTDASPGYFLRLFSHDSLLYCRRRSAPSLCDGCAISSWHRERHVPIFTVPSFQCINPSVLRGRGRFRIFQCNPASSYPYKSRPKPGTHCDSASGPSGASSGP